MIIDVTGIELTPGNCGKDCLGNGTHFDENGDLIECCCDECNYMLCCCEDTDFSYFDNYNNCDNCDDPFCPHSLKKQEKKSDTLQVKKTNVSD